MMKWNCELIDTLWNVNRWGTGLPELDNMN